MAKPTTHDVEFRYVEHKYLLDEPFFGAYSEEADFREWLREVQALAFAEGVNAFAEQLLKPLDENGIRPAIVNPYV